MPNTAPTAKELTNLLGKSLFEIWNHLVVLIDKYYDTEHQWNSGGKAWKWEYKYRRGGKTLCSLYARENCIGFMIIFGKEQNLKRTEQTIPRKRKRFTMKQKHTPTENGYCSNQRLLSCLKIL